MAAGKLVFKVAALAPILAMAGMGYEARKPHAPFTFTEYTSTANAAIEAYIPLVREFETTIPFSRAAEAAPLRKFADDWAAGLRSGKYPELYPAFLNESDQEGPREQVILIWDRVVSELEILENQDMRAGDWHAVSLDLCRCFAVMRGLKYADITTLNSANSQQRGIVGRIREQYKFLARPDRLLLASALEKTTDTTALHALLERSHLNLEAYTNRLEAMKEEGDGDGAELRTDSEQELKSEQFAAKEERYLKSEVDQTVRLLRGP